MFKMEFNTSNSAFDESPEWEIEALLKRVSREVIDGQTSGPIRDTNGNAIGEWSLTSEEG